MACKTQLPDLPLSLAILWVSQTYEIKFVFLLVILSYVNVVIKPVKETQRLEGKFSSPITQRNSVFLFLFLKNMTFFFFSFLAGPQHMEFLVQGSDLGHSCDPSYSCSNTRSLTHCARQGIEPVPQCSQDAAESIVPQGELQDTMFNKVARF